MLRSAHLVAALVSILLAGCGKPKDPLDWKIDGRTPAEYNAWARESVLQMPESLRNEFDRAFDEIVLVTGRAGIARNMADSTDPFCRRVDGRTVRYVLLDAAQLELERRSKIVETESDLMLRNLQSAASASDSRAEGQLLAHAKQQERRIAFEKQRLQVIRQRIAELRASATPK